MAEQAVSMRIGQRQRRGACDGCPGGADEAGVQHHVRGLPRRPLRAGRLLAAAVAAALIGTVRGGLEHLLTVMNKLQDVTSVIQDSGQATGIELPQIVVVGTQSSGKSSVSARAGGAACHARLCTPAIQRSVSGLRAAVSNALPCTRSRAVTCFARRRFWRASLGAISYRAARAL